MQQQQNVPIDELFDYDDETTYRDMLREELKKNWANGFCRMPDAVRNDPTLSPKAKIVYEQLLAHMWFSTDRCYPSQQTLADETGYSRRTVIRACKELYERGYIEKWRRGQGHSNYYFINPLTFPRSFRRTTRERAETTILDVRAPERQEDCSCSTPHSLDTAFSLCQDVTSRSDNVSHPEVPGCHPKQRSENHIHGKERSSNDSTLPQKGRGFPVVTQATRNEQQQKGTPHRHSPSESALQHWRNTHDAHKPALGNQERHSSPTTNTNEPVPPSKPNSSTSGSSPQAVAGRAKDVKDNKIAQPQTKQAAIAQATGIPQNHLEELEIAQEPRRRPIPEFIRDIVSRYSHELGDTSVSTKSNITRAAKLYFFALDYIKDAQDDPQGFFAGLLYEAKQAAYRVNGIRYWGANNRPNRMPVFFTCLENLFELRDEELAYIRSDEPLFEQAW
jgi:DNA-binding transcriptional regulator YhcF (GntR family)